MHGILQINKPRESPTPCRRLGRPPRTLRLAGFFYEGGLVLPQEAIFFIDGFNLYHALDQKASRKKYKWLDLPKLCRQFISSDERIKEVMYFTARPTWNQQKLTRHDMFIEICKSVGCDVILGNFQLKDHYSRVQCGKPCVNITTSNSNSNERCKKKYSNHEEKKTDVNIAVEILKACIEQRCQSIYLISGDNDLVPPLDAVKKLFSYIKITVLIPPHTKTKTLENTCRQNQYACKTISDVDFQRSLLPDPYYIGKRKIVCPDHWK